MQTRHKIKKEIIDNYKTNYASNYSLSEYISKFFMDIKSDYLLTDDELESIFSLLDEENKSNN